VTDLHFTKPHTKGKHLHYEDRIRLETYLREGRKKVEMAQLLECSRQTLDHEIARGRERVRTAPSAARPYWGEERLRPYNAAYAQAQYQLARKSSRKKRVVESFPDLFEALKIVLQPEKGKKKRSVEVALHELLDKFPEQPCVASVYHMIHQGFLGPKIRSWLMTYRKRKKKERHDYKKHLGTSIEERPEHINQRIDFGHWEIDLVLGKLGKGEVLLTLLERTTNFFIVWKCKDKRAQTIQNELAKIFKKYGRRNFKSITSDNGSEFSLLHTLWRIPVYFCHPYSSWEKGSVERHNRLLREFVPKGTPIENFSTDFILQAQNELNAYPRPSRRFMTPSQHFYFWAK